MTGNTLRANGDRRTRIDRRQFPYNVYLPERRSGEDRRSVLIDGIKNKGHIPF
jgi:hypothetical protein